MDNIFVLRDIKSAHFSLPSNFALGPPLKLGLMQHPGGRLARILTSNHFFHYLVIIQNGHFY